MRIVTLFCLALAIVASYAVKTHAADLKPGDDAPDFKMMGSDGKVHSLADYKGKQAIVIAWYPKAFTGGCTKECKSLAESGKLLKAYDVAYFTASCDTPELNKKFAESLNVDYPILSDPTREVATAYGVLNGDKSFRWTYYIGKDGKILYVDKEVKAPNHGPDVAAKLGELGVGKKS